MIRTWGWAENSTIPVISLQFACLAGPAVAFGAPRKGALYLAITSYPNKVSSPYLFVAAILASHALEPERFILYSSHRVLQGKPMCHTLKIQI